MSVFYIWNMYHALTLLMML